MRALFLFLALGSAPALAAETTVDASVKKDSKTGQIVAKANATLPYAIDELWVVFSDAIAGKLSDNTTLCLSIPDAHATSQLSALPAQRLPVTEADGEPFFEALSAKGSKTRSLAKPGEKVTRYLLRNLNIPVPFVGDRWFLAKEVFDAQTPGKYEFHLEGLAGNIRQYSASWSFLETDAGTDVRVHIVSDLDFSIPSAFAGLGTSEMKSSVERLSQLAKQEIGN